MTTQQIAVLSTADLSGGLTTDQIGTWSSDQLKALTSVQFAALSTGDVAAIATKNVQVLSTGVFAALKTAQVASLTTDQVVAMGTNQFAALGTTAASALTSDQVVAMSSDQLDNLSANQVAALSTQAVNGMETADLQTLKTAQIAALNTAQVTGLSTQQIVALSTLQVNTLTSKQLSVLSTDQAAAIETADIVALKTSAIPGFSTDAIHHLTTDQVHALTTQQIHALTNNQLSALTTDQIQALSSLTPVVLDLNGNGIETLSASAGVKFDLLATGQAQSMGWVGGGDGLLAMDRNGDGAINDGSELFGAGTTLKDGSKARTGYQAMAELDTNGDGRIDAKDADFAKLKVWVDANHDGVSQAGELKSLADLNITSLNLDVKKDVSLNNGNIVGLTSTFTTGDGTVHQAADVWFAAGSAPAADLRGSVGGLVQAMSSFGHEMAGAPNPGSLKLDGGQGASVAAHVSSLAGAMGQFDADGKLRAALNMAGTDPSLRLKALQSAAEGLLAAPKK
jgi:hypothetical protein